jgi:predicted phosphoribosyltransferase
MLSAKFYGDFSQVADEEVTDLIRRANEPAIHKAV